MKKLTTHILFAIVATLSTTCMTMELTKKSNKTDTHNIQEKKTFLQTNSLTQPDKNNLIYQLYTAASQIYMSKIDENSIPTHQTLINFIVLMNNAKQHNITEDYMGAFTYRQKEFYTPKPLYFNLLKKYNNTKEELPFTAQELCINSNLAQALKIPYTYQSIEEINNKLTFYPAYINLINKFKELHNRYNHYQLCVCLYSGTKTLFDDCSQYNNLIDFDDVYYHAYNNLKFNDDRICNFVHLIARIKNIENKTNDASIFSKILTYGQKQTSLKGWWLWCLSLSEWNYVNDSTKNKIALIYKLIEQYNHDRGNKKTPTDKQHNAFLSFKRLDITLTDKIDATLFDENEYAFEEFQKLSTNIQLVMNASEEELQRHVDYYLNEKEES